MTSEYLRTNGDLRRMIAAMVQTPSFMAGDLAPKMMTPIEFGVTMQRVTNSGHPWSVIGLADRSGRNLFDRASPDGYPETNQDYADSNYQLQKWSYCKELEQAFANALPHHWFEAEKIKDAAHRDAVIDYVLANRCGTSGTDHGWANCMIAIGGGVAKNDKPVLGEWPGLAPEKLHQNRDLKHTTDFRDVLGEVVSSHLGNGNTSFIIPGHEHKAVGMIS